MSFEQSESGVYVGVGAENMAVVVDGAAEDVAVVFDGLHAIST